jgi:hypothetical protein
VKCNPRCSHAGCPDSGGYLGNVASVAGQASVKRTHITYAVTALHVHPSPSTRPKFFCRRHKPAVERIPTTRTARLRGII